MMRWLGGLLSVEGLESVQDVSLRFAASWAQRRPVLVMFCCIAMGVVGAVFYLRFQGLRNKRHRITMAVVRAVLLALLLVLVAEPVVSLGIQHSPRSLLLLLFDCTDSMNISDDLSANPRGPDAKGRTRLALIRAAVKNDKTDILGKLGDKFRLRGYVLDRPDRAREILLSRPGLDRIDGNYVAEQLKGQANVTAIGAALDDLRRRSRTHLLAGVVVVSDFDQNRGQPALPAAEQLRAPINAVGVGPREVVDLSVDLQTPLVLKKGEKAAVTVLLRQSGLTGRDARIELLARRMGTVRGGAGQRSFAHVAPIRVVPLDKDMVAATVVYEPRQSGRFTLRARVPALDGEATDENNAAEREVVVRDESLKLLFVEYEPTWEWRFIKEVFYRHPMIGREGFRTYLDSADFAVRGANRMFLEALIRPRAEFFSYDVIFLSDVPGKMLSPHVQEMLREYVAKFGGGLVVISGARFGPGGLNGTKLADMLPVVAEADQEPRNDEFALQLTPEAEMHEFMKLGASAEESRQAWAGLDKLQWYQPVLRPHPLATVLAVHPKDRCVDGRTHQPLIAVRRYGKGEVVYFAFNELWRLRKMYGEKYYSQFWGQLIYRLGLGRALGSQKRFRLQTDRHVYEAGQKVRITVEAYTRSYDPLGVKALSGRLLAVESPGAAKDQQTRLALPLARDEVIFETSVPVFSIGLHRLLVEDPVTGNEVEVTFKVAPVSPERRSTVRNVALQRALAEQTGGRAYELAEIGRLTEDVKPRNIVQYTRRQVPLWNTWLVLLLVLALMLGEWTVRKLLNLQ